MGPPSTWLKNFDPGIKLPTGGLDYITGKFIPFLVGVALYVLTVASLIFILVGGIKWIMGGGDKEALAKAKGTVTYAIVGLVLGLGSFIILNIIGKIFGVSFF